jgi:hypothetical protein
VVTLNEYIFAVQFFETLAIRADAVVGGGR